MSCENDHDGPMDWPVLIYRTKAGHEFEVDLVDPVAAAWDLKTNLPQDELLDLLRELVNQAGHDIVERN